MIAWSNSLQCIFDADLHLTPQLCYYCYSLCVYARCLSVRNACPKSLTFGLGRDGGWNKRCFRSAVAMIADRWCYWLWEIWIWDDKICMGSYMVIVDSEWTYGSWWWWWTMTENACRLMLCCPLTILLTHGTSRPFSLQLRSEWAPARN